MKQQQLPEPSAWDYTVMDLAGWVVYTRYINRYQHAGKLPVEQQDEYIRQMHNTRYWWVSRYFQNRDKPMHPVVDKFRKQWRPLDWQQLMFEHPYVSEKDPTKIDYTPSERYGQDDRQVVISIGKYLNRHWPHVADHLRRDAVAAYTFDEMPLVYTMPEIIQGVEMGPRSCMQSGYGSIPFNKRDHDQMCEWFKDPQQSPPEWHKHPYVVYDPAFGWHMAIRKKDGVFLGRAVCLTHEGTNMFVRSYCRRSNEETSSSSSDQILEQWLEGQGYEKRSYWPDGAKFKWVNHPTESGPMMPYLDGDSGYRTVNDYEGDCLVMDYNGSITCDKTDGTVTGYDEESEYDEPSPDYICEDCGAHIYEDDDRLHAGRYEDHTVCGSCMDNYTCVHGEGTRGTIEYYVHTDNAEELQCGSYSIDSNNPPDGVVCLHDGDYALTEDAVYIDSASEYYLKDDDEVILREDGEYDLKNNCWMCEGSEEWYSNDETDDQVELDGGYYHRDHLRELVNAKQVPLPIDEPPAPTPEPAFDTGWGRTPAPLFHNLEARYAAEARAILATTGA